MNEGSSSSVRLLQKGFDVKMISTYQMHERWRKVLFLNINILSHIGLINNSNLTVDVQHTVPLYLLVEHFPTPNTSLSTEVKFYFLNCFCTKKSANESW